MRKAIVGLMCFVLVGALVYYNFIDKPHVESGGGETSSIEGGDENPHPIGVQVGNTSPNFTVNTMAADGNTFAMTDVAYTLNEHSGKVRVVNFWATWCAACKHELPDFDAFAKAYPNVEVIAICGSSGTTDIVINWMNNAKQDAQKNGWSDYSLTFGFYGPDQDVYGNMGGQGMWPMTVVVDEEGIIRYTSATTLDFEGLEEIVLPLLND